MTSYELKQRIRIEELAADAVIYEHKKTGARVFVLECEDDNKVFAIGFRTPPENSTGVPHIIEHTVLCGSRKYPVKDPFIELAKGSLNTFLNAMTYPDKTVFPVASCNDKDFENLVDVYCDAVFHPNIYNEKKIFQQEGWHYELETPESPLTYNGVVYNEMKGVYSSPDSLLERAIGKVLFENHTYGTESGGDPENIPELSYEEFLDFHRRYYHPSNAYIYLYGNMDAEKMLEKLDRDYLCEYERLDIDSSVPEVPAFAAVKDVTFDYPISDSEDENAATIFSIHDIIGGELDPVKYVAYQILEDVLLDVPGAPLREALQQAGIGDDIGGGYASGIRQPYFSVTAKNCHPEQKQDFLRIVRETLAQQAKGMDHEAIKASINVMEFRIREADFGSYPKGLIYGLNSFDSWLYDEEPTLHLHFNKVFAELKAKVDDGYFEKLLSDALIGNPSEAVITLNPVKGLEAQKEAALAAKLEAIKSAMTPDEIQQIVAETKALKAYQEEPSKEEDLLKIPLLAREDIAKEAQYHTWEEKQINGFHVLDCNVFTSGIAYIKLFFNLKDVAPEDIPYVSFLTEVLGYIDTEKHTYGELSTLINLNAGGVGFCTDSYVDVRDYRKAAFTFAANSKVLYGNIGFSLDVINEILFTSRLDDKKRLKDILAEVKARQKEAILAAGHQTALNRAGAQISCDRWFTDSTKGIAYYRMLETTDADTLSEKLRQIVRTVLRPENCTYHFVCDSEGLELCHKAMTETGLCDVYSAEERKVQPGDVCSSDEGKAELAKSTEELSVTSPEMAEHNESKKLPVDATADYPWDIFKDKTGGKKEVYTAATMVNYVARFGNFRHHGYTFTGALAVLRNLLNYQYLWNQIRVLGGAYGCSAIFGMSGATGLTSFRDPKLLKTDEVFRGIADYAESYEADEREMTKAVIGAMSELDMPLTPLTKGLRALSAYMSHITKEDRQRTRNQILAVTPDDIRALAPLLRAAISDECVCALAGEAATKECDESWEVQTLYQTHIND